MKYEVLYDVGTEICNSILVKAEIGICRQATHQHSRKRLAGVLVIGTFIWMIITKRFGMGF